MTQAFSVVALQRDKQSAERDSDAQLTVRTSKLVVTNYGSF